MGLGGVGHDGTGRDGLDADGTTGVGWDRTGRGDATRRETMNWGGMGSIWLEWDAM